MNNDQPDQPKPKKRRFGLAGLYLVIFIVLIILVGWYVLKMMNGSSSGIIYKNDAVLSGAPVFDLTPVPVVGKYISFSYPKALSIDTNPDKQPYPTLETFGYKYQDTEPWQLNIEVTQLASNSLTADSGYYERVLNSSKYQSSSFSSNGNSYVIMTDLTAGDFNEVAYSLHDGMSADVSLTGADPDGQTYLVKTLDQVLSTLEWHN